MPVGFYVTIKKRTGIEREKLKNFDDDEAKECSDVVLKIGDREFYVLKKYLASHSSYFKTLFSQNFAESQKSEIELKDIDVQDFQDFLELIHGVTLVNDETVSGILKLADYFDAPIALQRCEEFLMKNSKNSLAEKLGMSIKCIKIIEMKKSKIFDDDLAKEHSDVMLQIGDQKFYVLKKYLAIHSSYFKTLFSRKFAESQKSEIELKDIDTLDFQDFMELIHGVSLVNDETVSGILKLADYFDASIALQRCEKFLMKNSKNSLAEKYEMSIQYKMENLKLKCSKEMENSDDDAIQEVPDYSDYFAFGF